MYNNFLNLQNKTVKIFHKYKFTIVIHKTQTKQHRKQQLII